MVLYSYDVVDKRAYSLPTDSVIQFSYLKNRNGHFRKLLWI